MVDELGKTNNISLTSFQIEVKTGVRVLRGWGAGFGVENAHGAKSDEFGFRRPRSIRPLARRGVAQTRIEILSDHIVGGPIAHHPALIQEDHPRA